MSKTRNFVFTLNNYTNDDIDYLNQIPCRYLCYGKEKAPTTGTPHLQGFVVWENPRYINGVRRILRNCHVEVARGSPSQCIDYCAKDGDFYERGTRPITQGEKGDKERLRWATALENARRGTLDEIDPQILICHYGAIRRIEADSMGDRAVLPTTCGIWFVGPSGCGKSSGVRNQFPDLYPKPLNKWWDGYTGQQEVLIDDVDRSHSTWIGTFLKIWADHYPFIAESKGRSNQIRPKRLLVTSQYRIEHLFGGDGALVEAVQRRFKVVEVVEGEPINWEEIVPDHGRGGELPEEQCR